MQSQRTAPTRAEEVLRYGHAQVNAMLGSLAASVRVSVKPGFKAHDIGHHLIHAAQAVQVGLMML